MKQTHSLRGNAFFIFDFRVFIVDFFIFIVDLQPFIVDFFSYIVDSIKSVGKSSGSGVASLKISTFIFM
ncbi:hypothetical protein [Planomicrobium okeanokoites]|uniref:Uncharacterized protein n=1 Tax=Planomicrobium okeanokoites TaxID=244 RepID=A0ABV7KKZ0_PLAOK|nr:hypothetical protein [Planomicrobium okeanokoites]TAA69462.1 hypothetical protein D2910_08995 [Planomicrobium okeanokoites]